MHKLLLSFLLVGVLIAVGVFAFSKQAVAPSPSQTSIEEAKSKQDMNIAVGSYLEYKNGIIEPNTNKRRVLFFYASWCPTCRPADSAFKANLDKIPEDVELIRVNYEDTDTDQEEKELADKYNITYQHTFVQIDPQGQVVSRWNGGQINELLSNLKS